MPQAVRATSPQIIGLIGGLRLKSAVEYYRLINEGVRDRLGGLHSARCLLCGAVDRRIVVGD